MIFITVFGGTLLFFTVILIQLFDLERLLIIHWRQRHQLTTGVLIYPVNFLSLTQEKGKCCRIHQPRSQTDSCAVAVVNYSMLDPVFLWFLLAVTQRRKREKKNEQN